MINVMFRHKNTCAGVIDNAPATRFDIYFTVLMLFMSFLLVGCGSGAVVFAPTPLPPDLSPLRYEHPSGVFSLIVPRAWSVHTQNTTTLVSAAFSPPNQDDAQALFTVMNLGETLDSAALGELITRYQTQIRPDAGRYTEQNRSAMGDGSWRMTGLRRTPGGITQQVNTFIEQNGTFIAVMDVALSENVTAEDLQLMLNSFTINENAALEQAELTVLAYAVNSSLDILHVDTWTTANGVFFITGEIANTGSATVTDLPITATLRTSDGLSVIQAEDRVMGHGLLPGEFAPFSLRFGQGQPSVATGYELVLGNIQTGDITIYGANALEWTDESRFTEDGQLMISGDVTNTSTGIIRNLRATLTVFDESQNVIAAAFRDIAPQIAPDETLAWEMGVNEIGGEPARYIVNIQGLP
jgi:hypothetical protein